MEDITSAESLSFDLSTLKVATDDFSGANKLGEGDSGSVYKVILLSNMDPSSIRCNYSG